MPTTNFPCLYVGSVYRAPVGGELLPDLIAGVGTETRPDEGSVVISSMAAINDYWQSIDRALITIDTSSLVGAGNISAASLFIYLTSSVDHLGHNQSFNVVSANPFSPTSVADSDYQTFGIIKFSSDYELTQTENAWLEIVLNAAGIAAISRNGITKLGIRITSDGLGGAVAWTSSDHAIINFDDAGGVYPPYLEVTYTPLPFSPLPTFQLF